MEKYLDFLVEWDQYTEYAKSIDEKLNKLILEWGGNHNIACYTVCPSRKWSIAMQYVYKGNVPALIKFMAACPPPINPWELLSRDCSSMKSIAAEKGGDMKKHSLTQLSQSSSNVTTLKSGKQIIQTALKSGGKKGKTSDEDDDGENDVS
jgi:hypothetical protein